MAQSTPRSGPPSSADPDDELPVGVQLAWRLRALIAAGRLAAGERLPSVRTMAEWAEVNVNTVRAVYARLEDEGLIASRHGLGSYVADGAGGSPEVERIAAEAIEAAARGRRRPARRRDHALVSAALPEALDGAADRAARGRRRRSSTSSELATELDLDDPGSRSTRARRRRELRRQIGRLEAELASYTRELEPPPSPPFLNPAGRGSPASPSSSAPATRCSTSSPRRGPRPPRGPAASAARARSATRWSPTRPATAGGGLGGGDRRPRAARPGASPRAWARSAR